MAGNMPDRHRIRTLVVDDSLTALRAMCSLLKRQPAIEVVGTAQDGCEAIEEVRNLRPELVLLDVQMPVMDGIEAATQLNRDFPATRIIMVTVHDSPAVRQACQESGAHAFIAKEQLDHEFPVILRQLFGFA